MKNPGRMKHGFLRMNVVRGFTLIELLVVIAIIGILIAILMPNFKNALDKSKEVTCANNLKNIGQAMGLFMQGHNGFFPADVEMPDMLKTAQLSDTFKGVNIVAGDRKRGTVCPKAEFVANPKSDSTAVCITSYKYLFEAVCRTDPTASAVHYASKPTMYLRSPSKVLLFADGPRFPLEPAYPDGHFTTSGNALDFWGNGSQAPASGLAQGSEGGVAFLHRNRAACNALMGDLSVRVAVTWQEGTTNLYHKNPQSL